MASVEELEELGRVIMGAGVTAEYLGLSGVVSWLDTAFAEIVRRVVEERQRAIRSARVAEEELAEGL